MTAVSVRSHLLTSLARYAVEAGRPGQRLADAHPLLLADFEGEIPWDLLGAYDGAAFYVNGGKAPSKQWVAEGASRGKILLPIFEKGGHGSSTASLGVPHANEACALLDAFNVPKSAPWACGESDYDADPNVVGGYYHGLHDQSVRNGRPNIIDYADGAVGRMVKAKGWAMGAWLTCSGGFEGSGDHTNLDMWQRCAGEPGLVPVPGHSVDTDIILNPNLGLWGMAHAPSPAPPAWVPPAYPGGIKGLAEGDRGPAVAQLKVLLILAGYGHGLDTSSPDKAETFGAGTTAEVKKAQADYYRNARAKGTPDGRVGPRTWGWLCDVVKVRKAQAGKG